MLQFQEQFDNLQVPVERITKTLDRILGQVIREAARQWLRKMITHVPVETGMAMGALQPLGRFLRVAVPIRSRRKPYFSKLEGASSDPVSGAARSTFVIKDKFSSLQGMVYSFEWSTEVLHYYLRQFYQGRALSGEEAILEAEQAFTNHVVSTIQRRVPQSLQEFIMKERNG